MRHKHGVKAHPSGNIVLFGSCKKLDKATNDEWANVMYVSCRKCLTPIDIQMTNA